MTFTCNLSLPGLLFIFNAKKATLNSFSFKGFSRKEVVIFGYRFKIYSRYDSKFVLLRGILVASLDPTFIK